jgi:hypothetical protein
MFRLFLPLVAIGFLAGAAHAQEREWSLDASEDDAYLIFGVADSDDVGLSLWCPVGKGVVNLFLPVPTSQMPKSKDKAAPLTVTAGKETATFRGKADINREAAVSSLEAEIAVDHPLIAALKDADRLTIKTGTAEIVFPLFDADVEGLLALCKKN